MTGKLLFTRLVATHKPTCSLALDGPLPEVVADPAELARTLGSDELGRYALDCKPIYEDCRRIIGQLAGLSILMRLTANRETRDLDELKSCRERLQQAGTRLEALQVPAGAAPHRRQLETCVHFCGLAMGTFSEAMRMAGDEHELDAADVLMKRAYAHLLAASAERAGLQMVDFANACCSCTH